MKKLISVLLLVPWLLPSFVYGGGFNVEATEASYRAAVERTRSFLTTLSVSDQAKVLGSNAVKLFGFKPDA